jgi:nitroreductase
MGSCRSEIHSFRCPLVRISFETVSVTWYIDKRLFSNYQGRQIYERRLSMFKDLVKQARSYRRFYGDKEITKEHLRELADYGRLSPSGANRQPLKYILVNSREMNDKVYENVAWAGYLKDWEGPVPVERPTGYIIMLRDNSINKVTTMDEGIAAQSIFLGAADMGLGGCFIGSFKKEQLKGLLEVNEEFDITLVIALGYPKEEVVLEDITAEGDVKYWRDERQVHHVPKRTLGQVIVKEV